MTVPTIVKKIWLNSFCALAVISTNLAAQILIDQTALIVGKRVVTARDVELDDWLQRVIEQRKPIEFRQLRNNPEAFSKVQNSMLKRLVIRNYLVTTGLLPTAPAAQLEKQKMQLQAAWGGNEGMIDILKKNDFSQATVDLLLTDHVMSETFFSEHLPFRVSVTDSEVKAYYEKMKESRFLGKPLSQVMEIARANLKKEKTEKELESWLQTEMRRTEVVVLPVKSG